ncbi:MAG TPA: TIGR03435 family protein [Bryobacteraceae bacterium]|nr:TIGR03435 family protein [Bryobacteraceae bacterium]
MPLKLNDDGCPLGNTGMMVMAVPGRFRIGASKATMENLLSGLSGQFDRPVFDKTGLDGKYDFQVEFLPDGQAGMTDRPAGRRLAVRWSRGRGSGAFHWPRQFRRNSA